MPVIEQIKNFIRQAEGKRQLDKHEKRGEKTGKDHCSDIARIVAEERQARERIPHYPGLDRYKLLEKIGDGAYSCVYKAVDRVTGEKVAIKIIRKQEVKAAKNDVDKHVHKNVRSVPPVPEHADIYKEVQIMRKMNHPSIIKLLDFSESADYYYMILELMEGGELFYSIVRFTYFSEQLARHIIIQVAEGIRYMHNEKGVVHRDIKPENLLIEPIPLRYTKQPNKSLIDGEVKEDEGEFIPGVGGGGIGRVKIADFGLSKVIWEESTHTPCGTVGYTAPEVVKDKRYSKGVDMWALGCVLYTLLCGFPPFYDENISQLTRRVAHGEYTFLSPWWDPISEEAKDLIRHLLCVDPHSRYSIDEFFAHPWIQGKTMKDDSVERTVEESGTENSSWKLVEIPQSEAIPKPKRGRKENISPGLAILRDAIDISHAVQRVEEEEWRNSKLFNGNQASEERRERKKNQINSLIYSSDLKRLAAHNKDQVNSITALTPKPPVPRLESPPLSHSPIYGPFNDAHLLQELTREKQAARQYLQKIQPYQPMRMNLDLSHATLLERRRQKMKANNREPMLLFG
ncbi:uncharacterized protein VTP21DRAFT_7736 [Calcarisporiella thermophila]|uniref:uncharacterized protein n=1 Tax=Calcarisporiella thermophila TaxID=911321 RepID=UPI003742C6F3